MVRKAADPLLDVARWTGMVRLSDRRIWASRSILWSIALERAAGLCDYLWDPGEELRAVSSVSGGWSALCRARVLSAFDPMAGDWRAMLGAAGVVRFLEAANRSDRKVRP